MAGHVDISGLSKCEVLAALFSRTKVTSMDELYAPRVQEKLTELEAAELCENNQDKVFDTIKGVEMYVDLSRFSFDPTEYDSTRSDYSAQDRIDALWAALGKTPPPRGDASSLPKTTAIWVSIQGLPKAYVLAALYNQTKVATSLADLFAPCVPDKLNDIETGCLWGESRTKYFHTVKHREMEVDLSGDSFDPTAYNGTRCEDHAQERISALRVAVETELSRYDNFAQRPRTIYTCETCAKKGVKLWRPYPTGVELLCARCTLERSGKHGVVEADGTLDGCDTIGWWQPAVPRINRPLWWARFSAPEVAMRWWKALPLN
jgi:hypothetical protein